ncbi:hypothetical protein [Woodsholea maritima]|uniref:hypothetical protein n=1 Tax=Woodsholea maritima TaxID=240237 RepID=UPI00036123E4|nr:hypothetical protein [Woodsholea maritima]
MLSRHKVLDAVLFNSALSVSRSSWLKHASISAFIAGFYNAKDEASFEQKRLELRDKFVLRISYTQPMT